MKKKKITFSEPNCRFGCPHFKSVGSVLNETCYCMKKGKKGRRLGKKDLKRRPPEWCPRRLKTPVCRIYGFKDEMHEALELDNRLNFEPDKHDWYFPSSHHYGDAAECLDALEQQKELSGDEYNAARNMFLEFLRFCVDMEIIEDFDKERFGEYLGELRTGRD